MPKKSTIDDKQIRMAEELLFSGKQLPSFAKALYFGIFDGDRVFPFPEVNAEERLRTDAFIAKLKASGPVGCIGLHDIERVRRSRIHALRVLPDGRRDRSALWRHDALYQCAPEHRDEGPVVVRHEGAARPLASAACPG